MTPTRLTLSIIAIFTAYQAIETALLRYARAPYAIPAPSAEEWREVRERISGGTKWKGGVYDNTPEKAGLTAGNRPATILDAEAKACRCPFVVGANRLTLFVNQSVGTRHPGQSSGSTGTRPASTGINLVSGSVMNALDVNAQDTSWRFGKPTDSGFIRSAVNAAKRIDLRRNACVPAHHSISRQREGLGVTMPVNPGLRPVRRHALPGPFLQPPDPRDCEQAGRHAVADHANQSFRVGNL